MKRTRCCLVAALPLVAWMALPARSASSAPPKKAPPIPSASVAASASASASAWATVTPPPAPKGVSETLTGEAKKDFEEGAFAYKNGDYAGALVKLRAAYDLSHDARLHWNMALCEQKLRHYADATRLFQRYLVEGGDLVTAEDRESAKKKMEEIEPFTSSLVFTVDQKDAEVFVDDVPIGKTPLAAGDLVDVGTRKITVKKEGFAQWKNDVFVDGSKREVPVDVKLVVEKHEGKVTIRAPAGAEIFIDNVRVAVGEWTGILPSKGHTLRVTAPGMRVYQSEIVVQDNDNRTIDVPLEPFIEPPEVYDRWEADLRAGYGELTGNDKPAMDSIEAAIGIRFGRPTWFGLALQYGNISSAAGTCGRRMNGPGLSGPLDFNTHYSFDACHIARAGFLFMIHFLPRTIIDPWIGIGVGGLLTWGTYRAYDPVAGADAPSSKKGFGGAILAGGQIGVDVHPIEAFKPYAVGPFFAFDYSIIGGYGLNNHGGSNDPNDAKDNGDNHPFTQFVLGVRNAISF